MKQRIQQFRQYADQLPPFVKEFARILQHPIQRLFLRGVYNRIRQLEYRAFNRRFYAVDQVAEYLIGAQVIGDYCEFGVYQGATFIYAYQTISPHFNEMRFAAFDSFEGLPHPSGVDSYNGYTSHFYKGQFSFSHSQFVRNLKRKGVNLQRVITVQGWFNESLAIERSQIHGIDNIAVAWIDCDLYESTVPVLDYLTPRLNPGAVVIFDDWRCYRNHPDYGEQRACREWLERNPQISLKELLSFGWNGIAFTVTSC
ncbi:MAG: TylF/MycF family methyltransferase [Desulfobacterales bacterium]|nr:TylF/MycF family methyltransferase [Desulfobacterales bacterium]